jgi:hypothetical protein
MMKNLTPICYVSKDCCKAYGFYNYYPPVSLAVPDMLTKQYSRTFLKEGLIGNDFVKKNTCL